MPGTGPTAVSAGEVPGRPQPELLVAGDPGEGAPVLGQEPDQALGRHVGLALVGAEPPDVAGQAGDDGGEGGDDAEVADGEVAPGGRRGGGHQGEGEGEVGRRPRQGEQELRPDLVPGGVPGPVVAEGGEAGRHPRPRRRPP
jgi:hypothetical protein